jgi:hypothetical protein
MKTMRIKYLCLYMAFLVFLIFAALMTERAWIVSDCRMHVRFRNRYFDFLNMSLLNSTVFGLGI